MVTVDAVSRPHSYSMHRHTHGVCVRLQALKSDKRPDGEWYYFIHYPVSPHSKHDCRRAQLCCLGPSNCFVSVSSGAACATVQDAPDFRAQPLLLNFAVLNKPRLQGWDKQYDEWVVARDLVKWDEKLLKVDLTKESTGLPQAMVEGEVDEDGSGKFWKPWLAVSETAGWLLLEGTSSCGKCRSFSAEQAEDGLCDL